MLRENSYIGVSLSFCTNIHTNTHFHIHTHARTYTSTLCHSTSLWNLRKRLCLCCSFSGSALGVRAGYCNTLVWLNEVRSHCFESKWTVMVQLCLFQLHNGQTADMNPKAFLYTVLSLACLYEIARVSGSFYPYRWVISFPTVSSQPFFSHSCSLFFWLTVLFMASATITLLFFWT